MLGHVIRSMIVVSRHSMKSALRKVNICQCLLHVFHPEGNPDWLNFFERRWKNSEPSSESCTVELSPFSLKEIILNWNLQHAWSSKFCVPDSSKLPALSSSLARITLKTKGHEGFRFRSYVGRQLSVNAFRRMVTEDQVFWKSRPGWHHHYVAFLRMTPSLCNIL